MQTVRTKENGEVTERSPAKSVTHVVQLVGACLQICNSGFGIINKHLHDRVISVLS